MIFVMLSGAAAKEHKKLQARAREAIASCQAKLVDLDQGRCQSTPCASQDEAAGQAWPFSANAPPASVPRTTSSMPTMEEAQSPSNLAPHSHLNGTRSPLACQHPGYQTRQDSDRQDRPSASGPCLANPTAGTVSSNSTLPPALQANGLHGIETVLDAHKDVSMPMPDATMAVELDSSAQARWGPRQASGQAAGPSAAAVAAAAAAEWQAEALKVQGSVLYKGGDWAGAWQAYTKAVNLAPQSGVYRANRAVRTTAMKAARGLLAAKILSCVSFLAHGVTLCSRSQLFAESNFIP